MLDVNTFLHVVDQSPQKQRRNSAPPGLSSDKEKKLVNDPDHAPELGLAKESRQWTIEHMYTYVCTVYRYIYMRRGVYIHAYVYV